MFKTVINYQRILPVLKKLNHRNLPSVVYNSNFSNPTKTDAKSKEKKSIYDCENETWCEPKKEDNTVTTYKKIYFDEHSPPEWIEIVIRKKWTDPDVHEE